jgi:hypothetical protein
MQNTWRRNPAIQERLQPIPRHLGTLTTAEQDLPPLAPQAMPKSEQPIEISRHRVVLVVPKNRLPQPFSDDGRRFVHPATKLRF